MGRPSLKAQRRAELVRATIRTIHEEGLDGASLARIAKRAGMAASIVSHYFGDKAELLEATMRHLGRELGESTAARLKACETPEQRLFAVVEANLDPSQFRPETIAVWLAFWSRVNHWPRLARIQRVVSARLMSNLRQPLRAILRDDEEAARIAFGLSILIDGLWLRAALSESGVDPEHTRRVAEDYLNLHLDRARIS